MSDIKLPVRETLVAAFQSLPRHAGAFLRLFRFPFLAFAAADGISRTVSQGQLDPVNKPEDAAVLFGAFLAMAFATVAVVPAATAWHRLILFGPEAAPPRYSLSGKELRYGLYALLYCLVIILAGILGGLLPLGLGVTLNAFQAELTYQDIEQFGALMALLAMLLALFATTRLFLLFPGVAVGDRIGVGAAGRAARGNQFRLFAACMAPMLPVLAIQLGTMGGPAAWAWPLALLSTALLLPFLAASVSVLSISYRHLYRREPRPAPTVAV